MRGIIYFHIKWKESALADSSFTLLIYFQFPQDTIPGQTNYSNTS